MRRLFLVALVSCGGGEDGEMVYDECNVVPVPALGIECRISTDGLGFDSSSQCPWVHTNSGIGAGPCMIEPGFATLPNSYLLDGVRGALVELAESSSPNVFTSCVFRPCL